MRDWQPFAGLPLWFCLFILQTFLAVFCLFYNANSKSLMSHIWSILDRVYLGFGILSAIFMVIILLLIVGQMVARWTSTVFPGGTEFAGYAMACTSFFALAFALTQGSHIRVSIFLNMNDFLKFWLDAFAMLVSAWTATYFARYAVKTNFLSEVLNDRTQGLDQVPEWFLSLFSMIGQWPWEWGETWSNTTSNLVYTPVWLPQIAMSVGTILLAIAIWDHLFRLLAFRETRIFREAIE